ncbi:MAG: anaerobic ribonucleoside-triphosphate reductase activating protein [Succinivibrio sp.]|jgi:anaerobic ribonucleoside-triphosphate reductase activating protein|nr:anaerobic ribonucleoside-triphosphate reductase activating protein [Succinivibrio sp.]
MNDRDILDKLTLRIAGALQESVVDGTGIRYVIFAQGCPFHCKGCHNPQSWDFKGGVEVKLSRLYDEFISDPLLSGVTFSGGEPFMQPLPLAEFAKAAKHLGMSVWSYTGFTYEKLIRDPQRFELLKQLDILVDGPFVLEKKSLELDFRGSSNQRIIDVQKSLKAGAPVLAEGFH